MGICGPWTSWGRAPIGWENTAEMLSVHKRQTIATFCSLQPDCRREVLKEYLSGLSASAVMTMGHKWHRVCTECAVTDTLTRSGYKVICYKAEMAWDPIPKSMSFSTRHTEHQDLTVLWFLLPQDSCPLAPPASWNHSLPKNEPLLRTREEL